MKTIHITVTGRVQGVGFRYFTVGCANDLGIMGWVRNLPDGKVEAVIRGQDAEVKEMTRLIGRGPRAADVTDIRIEAVDAVDAEEFAGFVMRF
ncbi:MAG: acylphosphatase [Euryarchaeota archaeon]|nr:acylphosphatase [Euryarchaeota archaeon]